jgi:hypothetical protein
MSLQPATFSDACVAELAGYVSGGGFEPDESHAREANELSDPDRLGEVHIRQGLGRYASAVAHSLRSTRPRHTHAGKRTWAVRGGAEDQFKMHRIGVRQSSGHTAPQVSAKNLNRQDARFLGQSYSARSVFSRRPQRMYL